MAEYLIQGESLTAIADAIRANTGETAPLSLNAMAEAITTLDGTNFKIVSGTTEPTNPAENTIWVNTDTEITGWYFSATQPENMAEGEVWFPTGTSSPVEFNTLKKNNIQVYPLSAKQYVGGALVDVIATSYQGGEWVDWLVWLYMDGNDCTELTGGWSTCNLWKATQSMQTLGTCTLNDDSFTLVAGARGTAISRTTNNKIDLTDASEIYMTVTEYTGTSALDLSCGLEKDRNTESAKISHSGGTGTLVLDVSSLSGSFYVSITLGCHYSATGSRATITRIWYK